MTRIFKIIDICMRNCKCMSTPNPDNSYAGIIINSPNKIFKMCMLINFLSTQHSIKVRQ